MPYPEQLVTPMRAELTSQGFQELTNPQEVDSAFKNMSGTSLLVFNSVCGCAAGSARPGVLKSLERDKKPNQLLTVFAGQDTEAVEKARDYCLPYPPSSPSVALFKDGQLVHFVERMSIEGHTPDMIAENLADAYQKFC